MIDKQLLRNIRQAREAKNIEQEWVAQGLKISPATYSKIENGKVKVSADRLQELPRILNVSLECLLSDQPANPAQTQPCNLKLAAAKQQIINLLQQPSSPTQREEQLLYYIRLLEDTGQ